MHIIKLHSFKQSNNDDYLIIYNLKKKIFTTNNIVFLFYKVFEKSSEITQQQWETTLNKIPAYQVSQITKNFIHIYW